MALKGKSTKSNLVKTSKGEKGVYGKKTSSQALEKNVLLFREHSMHETISYKTTSSDKKKILRSIKLKDFPFLFLNTHNSFSEYSINW